MDTEYTIDQVSVQNSKFLPKLEGRMDVSRELDIISVVHIHVRTPYEARNVCYCYFAHILRIAQTCEGLLAPCVQAGKYFERCALTMVATARYRCQIVRAAAY